jgi:hypothetical protein
METKFANVVYLPPQMETVTYIYNLMELWWDKFKARGKATNQDANGIKRKGIKGYFINAYSMNGRSMFSKWGNKLDLQQQ